MISSTTAPTPTTFALHCPLSGRGRGATRRAGASRGAEEGGQKVLQAHPRPRRLSRDPVLKSETTVALRFEGLVSLVPDRRFDIVDGLVHLLAGRQ